MVGEKVDLLHSAKAGGSLGNGLYGCAVGIEAGDERHPDLHGHAALGQTLEVGQGQGDLAAGPVEEALLIHVLEIRQQQVEMGEAWLNLVPGHVQATFHCGMQSLGLAAGQQVGSKFGLHERFTAGEGDSAAAALEEGAIPQDGGHQGVQTLLPAAHLQRFAGAEAAQPFHIVGL